MKNSTSISGRFAVAVLAMAATSAFGAGLQSPNGKVSAMVFADHSQHLAITVSRGGKLILAPSPVGIVVEGRDLGAGARIESTKGYTVNEQYPRFGVHAVGRNHCRGTRYRLRTGDTAWELDVRAYDDGVAFKFACAAGGHFDGESTVLHFSDSLMARFMRHRFGEESRIYTGSITEIGAMAKGRTCPPLLLYPKDMSSYTMILEGGGIRFHGFSLTPEGRSGFRVAYAEKPKGWAIKGRIETAWKIICTVDTLDQLVNTDLPANVCPPPDPKLFPQGAKTEWIQPGTCTWNWWAKISCKFEEQIKLVDQAARIGAKYHLVDIGWDQKWGGDGVTPYDRLRQLCEYGARKGVGIWVWKCSDVSFNLGQNPGSPGKFKALAAVAVKEDADAMRNELKRIAAAGAKGIKLDYIQSESSRWKQYMEQFLRIAAENKLMVDFHGCPIPAGESRTYPNEVTREAIYGGEKLRGGGGAGKMPTAQYIDLAFTRFVAGHADYTPAIFVHPQGKGFTHAMQLASAIIFTSPLTVWADNPKQYLASPGVEIMRTLPTTWDETTVLPGSRLDKLAVFARRRANNWYIAGINGLADRTQSFALKLDFVDPGAYDAVLCEDDVAGGTCASKARRIRVANGDELKLTMLPSGGFIVRLTAK